MFAKIRARGDKADKEAEGNLAVIAGSCLRRTIKVARQDTVTSALIAARTTQRRKCVIEKKQKLENMPKSLSSGAHKRYVELLLERATESVMM